MHFLSLEISCCLSALNRVGCSEQVVLTLHVEHGQLVLAGSGNSFSIYTPPLRTVLAGYQYRKSCTGTH